MQNLIITFPWFFFLLFLTEVDIDSPGETSVPTEQVASISLFSHFLMSRKSYEIF